MIMDFCDYVIKKISLTPNFDELGVLLDSLICCRTRYLELLDEVHFPDIETEIEQRKRVSRKINVINSLINVLEDKLNFHYKLIPLRYQEKLTKLYGSNSIFQ